MNFYGYPIIINRRKMKSIRIRCVDGIINVNCPYLSSDSYILDLLEKNQKRILKMVLLSIKNDSINFLGNEYQIHLVNDNKNHLEIIGENIYIYYRKDPKKVLYQFYEKELKIIIDSLVNQAKIDFNLKELPNFKFGNMQSKYAYYDKKNNLIKFANSLAKYDKDYIKLIFYHELTHIFVSNHSYKFYQFLEERFVDAKKKQHQLRMLRYQDKF